MCVVWFVEHFVWAGKTESRQVGARAAAEHLQLLGLFPLRWRCTLGDLTGNLSPSLTENYRLNLTQRSERGQIASKTSVYLEVRREVWRRRLGLGA